MIRTNLIREIIASTTTPRRSAYLGCLLGLATGDAVGTTLEFKRPDTFSPITDMAGGGEFNLPAGAWTDDTSMALCLAESLIARRGFYPVDMMKRFGRWVQYGHLSSVGYCFDIGNTTSKALARFKDTGQPYAGTKSRHEAGNGSLMRLAPVVMAYAHDPELPIERAASSSLLTHGAQESVDACRYFAGLLVGALRGDSKRDLLRPLYHPTRGQWSLDDLSLAVSLVACGPFDLNGETPIGNGYVINSLEAALWAFCRSTNFEDGCLMAANLGDDADTTAAIYGQIAGAYYGVDKIPSKWLRKLYLSSLIGTYAVRLQELNDESRRK